MKSSAVTLILLVLSLSASPCAQAQTPPGQQDDVEVLRVSTDLVMVPVTVRTRQGTFVPNLRREDFRVYEDGVEQEIAHFETADKPFTVVLMLDMSDSTRIALKEIADAAIAFLNQLRPDDRAAVVAFDKRYLKLAEATNDRKVLAAAISRVRVGGGTALYDAVETTIGEELKQIPGRKAVVLLTDGIDTASVRATYQSTVWEAAEQYALIYPIQWDTRNDYLSKQLSRSANDTASGGVVYTTPSGEPLSKAYERGSRYLQLLAQNSGGRFQYADNLKNLERSFARIAEELREQYSLSYYPADKAPKKQKRRIKVKVNVPDLAVRARDSYSFKGDTR